MNVDCNLIEGVAIGYEHYYDEQENTDYHIVSLFIVQFIFSKEREHD